MAYVTVGSEAKVTIVHRDLIVSSSPFFKIALEGQFTEKGGKVQLPCQDSRHSAVYVHWLYFGATNVDSCDEILVCLSGCCKLRRH